VAQQDLDLTVSNSIYALADPITGDLQRMRNRFRVQFLSRRRSSGRGSIFYSELQKGRIRTNSDMVSIFAITASEIILTMRGLQQDIVPSRAELTDFSFPDARTVSLSITLYSSEGSIEDNIEVTT